MSEPSIQNGIRAVVETWPLLRFEMIGTPSEKDWVGMFAVYDQAYARNERFVALNDATKLSSAPTAAVRKRVASLAKAHEPQSKRWMIHSATVVSNPLLRGAMTALNWLAPPVYKQTVHATALEAVNALVTSLEREGLGMSTALRTYREALVAAR
jgi:hypothetical protein